MSASLVGSEMCIRDRLTCAVCVAKHVVPGQDPPINGRGLASQNTLNLAAVSYTHLTLPTICSV
eukprot:10430172-Alexandrium_andersonii.AAC.1